MKKIIVLFLGVFLALTGCSTFSSSESSVSSNDSSSTESSSSESSSSSEVVMKESRLHIYSVPEGVNQYQDAFLFVGETQIDLMAFKVNLSQSWDGLAPNRVDNGVAIVRLEGKASLSLMLLSYQYAFRDNKPALAAAVGVILALIIISLTVLYLFIVRKQDKEANV